MSDRKYALLLPYDPNNMLLSITLNRIRKYMRLKSVTADDFRATASTELNSLGYKSNGIIEA